MKTKLQCTTFTDYQAFHRAFLGVLAIATQVKVNYRAKDEMLLFTTSWSVGVDSYVAEYQVFENGDVLNACITWVKEGEVQSIQYYKFLHDMIAAALATKEGIHP